MSQATRSESAAELPAVLAGRLPERYRHRMQDVLLDRLDPLLRPGVRILDVGSGREPTLEAAARPENCHYTGLDVSAEELAAAAPGVYTDTVVANITRPLPVGGYDVITSWQVLEHVKPLDLALENLRSALVPGGTLLAQTSGSRAVFAVLARVLPHRVRVGAMARLLGHPPEAKFPTHFDRCRADPLREMLGTWSSAEVIPFYRGAPYFDFSRPLQRGYLAYEDRIARRRVDNLATHYLIVATR
jgi:2-polyprenyl-6-hydroxyphenyl methylase/3-demethylubiquinone-9 3-methyltransferase